MKETPRIAFFGTPDIARVFFDALVQADIKPALVVTSPDKPKGRGLDLAAPETKIAAEAYGITVLQPEKIDAQFVEAMASEAWDVFIVVAYGMILPQKLIDLPKYGTLNVHFSLLPRWRGASPVEAALLAGDTETGVAIQQMRYKLDSGPVVAARATHIQETETAPELRARLGVLGTELLVETLPRYIAGELAPVEQDESQATHAARMTKNDGELRAGDSDIQKWRKYRAYYAWPGTFFFTEKKGELMRVKVRRATFENGRFIIERVVPEGRREIAYEEFLRTYSG